MNTKPLLVFATILASVTLAQPSFARDSHEAVHKEVEDAVLKDLEGSYFDIRTTPAKAAKWNERMFSALERMQLPPSQVRGRFGSLSQAQIEELYHQASTDPVADYSKVKRYDPDGSFGFCWGRAMNAHLYALRMGLAKESIRKIWAVGTMKYNRIFWRYHVTTIVRRNDGTWMAIDPEYNKPITIREWYREVKAMDTDDKLQFYTSEARRYGPDSSDTYTNHQLDPKKFDPRARDYYNGYFRDLLAQSREEAREIMDQRRESERD